MKKTAIAILSMLMTVQVQAQTEAAFFQQLETGKVLSTNEVTWQQFGPGNAGFANLLRFHPTLPGVVALCPDMWNAYQSENHGKNWYGITDPDGDATFYHLRDLYYSPSDAQFGLAISSSELWQTHDMGKSWEVVPNCPWYKVDTDGGDQDRWKKKVASLAIDPNNKDVWYVGGGMNVRGQDWLSSYKEVTAENPHGKEAENEGKLWRSTNAGKSWQLITKGLPQKAQVGRITVNPNNSKQVFAASNYGIFRTDNGGKKWVSVSAGKLDNDIIMDMDAYYDVKSKKLIIYVIDQVQYLPDGQTTKCTGGVFCSEDAGKTWKKINGDLGLDIGQLSGGVPANYYKNIAKWMGISVKEARKKYPVLPKNALQRFNMISVDPSREKAVYLGFSDPQIGNSIMPGRLWVTENNGKKWTNTARLYEDAWAKDSRYWEARNNPYHENMEVGHYSKHMRFGKDYALRSMRALDVGVDGSVMIISDHSTMLSMDHGKTWKQMDEDTTPKGGIVGHGNSNLPGLTIAQDRRFETTLFGSGEHHLWIPTGERKDGIPAIRFVESTQPTVSNLAFDPYDGKTVYATSNRQENKENIFRSTDGGNTWENYGVATPATKKWKDDFYTNGLTIDPINNQYMYFGSTRIVNAEKGKQGGFFFSEDFGKTFKQRNNGLPSPARINDIQFDPRDQSRKSLFIAAEKNTQNYFKPVAEGGLYHSSDRGLNWKKVKTPKSVESVQFIKMDHTNRMYITTGHNGGGAGVWYTDDFGDSWEQIFSFAGTECIDISPFDHNLLVVSVRFSSLNQGIYISRDRGLTWTKNNRNIGIPHQIEDVKFDIFDASKMWLATKGCGFYEGEIKDGQDIQVVEALPNVADSKDGAAIQLKADIVNPDFKHDKIIWKSENPSVATVDRNGLVTPVSKGQTKIWATTEDGRFTDFSIITVHP
ncbi:Ig-like domain-containing protein [Limibacter armeniacum]|uniref:VPS10 domain-containing protein n=1 Tax=Limibacter armeniacum TaxID=466084 RepID=UPI002FE60F08